jgi:hypothetical protein
LFLLNEPMWMTRPALILTGFAEAAAAHAARQHILPGRTSHFEHSTSKGVPSKV